jgi:carboxymethylenebutenolidase
MAEYLALPKAEGPRPAIVLIHEWWGANDQMRSLADRWAAEGFLALVTDLYEGKVVPIGKSDEASAAMNALDFGKALQTIAAAVETLRTHARSNGKVAISGYCLGGALSFAASTQIQGLAAVVPFYGLPPSADWTKVDAPIQAHFATIDEWATVSGAKKIQDALAAQGKQMELHVYEAQHAFCNDQRPEVYDAAAAALAWKRAVEFVTQRTR